MLPGGRAGDTAQEGRLAGVSGVLRQGRVSVQRELRPPLSDAAERPPDRG